MFAVGPFGSSAIKMGGRHTHLLDLAVYLVASLVELHLAHPSAPGTQQAACQAWLASPLASLVVVVVVARQGLVLLLPRVAPLLSLLSHYLV